jgi:hypothetical protein
MDEMKQRSEIDTALRELAKRRDGLLRTAPSLSPERRAMLSGFLALKFPMESALREAATRRDRSLHPYPPGIPGSVESAFHRQLLTAEAALDGTLGPRVSDWRISGGAWLRIFRSQLGAVLTSCVVITAAIFSIGKWGTQPRHNAAENLSQGAGVNLESTVIWDRPSPSRTELFGRRVTIGPFNLNTSEPASLEASFVSNRRIQFADSVETPLGLRLDLPVRATLMEDGGLARTP